MNEMWKSLEIGRERLIYALGMLNSADFDTRDAVIDQAYQIIKDTLQNCSIYEKVKPDAEQP